MNMRVLVQTPGDEVRARSKARAFASSLGFKSGEATIVATLMSELARHVLLDDGCGEITVTAVNRMNDRGVILRMVHERPGLIDQPADMAGDPLDVDGAGWQALDGRRRLGQRPHALELAWGVTGMKVMVTRRGGG
jgi:serine/threonine-protein kinase RsbT